LASSNDVVGRDAARYAAASPVSGEAESHAAASGRSHSRHSGIPARIFHWIDRLESLIVGVILGSALLLVVVTIVLRYLAPQYAPQITDEVTVYMVMWAVLLACGGITSRGEHVKADLVVGTLSPRVQRICEIAGHVVGIGFCLVLAWFASQVTYEAWDFGDLSPTNLRFPMWIYYAALPLAAASMAVRHLIVLVRLLTGTRTAMDQR
jgi:TRAP-type C4-dicarboxylate transport system permease small subunit